MKFYTNSNIISNGISNRMIYKDFLRKEDLIKRLMSMLRLSYRKIKVFAQNTYYLIQIISYY